MGCVPVRLAGGNQHSISGPADVDLVKPLPAPRSCWRCRPSGTCSPSLTTCAPWAAASATSGSWCGSSRASSPREAAAAGARGGGAAVVCGGRGGMAQAASKGPSNQEPPFELGCVPASPRLVGLRPRLCTPRRPAPTSTAPMPVRHPAGTTASTCSPLRAWARLGWETRPLQPPTPPRGAGACPGFADYQLSVSSSCEE